MTNPSPHDLPGYLLGALEHDEQERVEQELELSPELREEALALKRSLRRMGLDCRPDHESAPAGLAQRTCNWIFGAIDQAKTVVKLSEVSPADLEIRPRSSAMDLSVAVAVLFIAAAVFFPALENSRFQAGVAACQNKLKNVGLALHEYSNTQPDRSFPKLAVQGNRAAAGVYAPVLLSHELVNDRKAFVCPQSHLARMLDKWDLPTLDELDDAVGDALETIQKKMGGSYGYTLGHVEDKKYISPINRDREFFALLGDVPSSRRPDRLSENHGRRGQNVFFEDGHVKFVKNIPKDGPMDDPFFNRHGLVAAGIDSDDAVLGDSSARPVTVDMLPMIDMGE